jgi:hypothetical protein
MLPNQASSRSELCKHAVKIASICAARAAHEWVDLTIWRRVLPLPLLLPGVDADEPLPTQAPPLRVRSPGRIDPRGRDQLGRASR